ncbi:DUF4924 family protein [Bacteroides sp. 519]|uniref:DUF4924 family protein n=1 Tax=Bacteroides sp. 519 TaxID=2302937 RepID=UPI0013D3CCEF|nr:DUF4924 family protein [Bacteroides sp. 519]NDV58137.1 DUF4924 family protein [Bacteroides sp. 519]
MYIAQQLKEKNIAEYLIYMWQVEDIIRANNLDINQIRDNIVAQYTQIQEAERVGLLNWYQDLINMMRDENVISKGHLQINKNVIINLTDLHQRLLASPKFPFYHSAYYKALPVIVELRSKSGNTEEPELETCFEALYGAMLLKLQQKTISTETTKALENISSFLSMLANYYDKDKKGELDLN